MAANKLNSFQSFAIWLAGFDNQTAAKCTTSEIQKMTIAGTMVCIPSFIALFSYGYAFEFIFNNNKIAVLGGLISAIVLLLIDRSIMAYGRPGKLSAGTYGRLFFAITIGFIMAEPLIIKIFEPSIDEQQHEELYKAQKKAATPYLIEIDKLGKNLKDKEERLEELRQAYTSEMDGTGGSGIPNKGPIFLQKKEDYDIFKAEFEKMRLEIDDKIATLNLSKEKRLKEIETLTANGLIGKMRALDALGKKEPVVIITTWLLRLFFILIELIPFLIKISPSDDRGLYYKLIDLFDKEQEDAMKGSSEERKQIMLKQEHIYYLEQYAAICQKEILAITNAKEKDMLYLMDRITVLGEKKMELKNRAFSNLKNDPMLEKIHSLLDSIFEGFINLANDLNNRSNENFSSNSF